MSDHSKASCFAIFKLQTAFLLRHKDATIAFTFSCLLRLKQWNKIHWLEAPSNEIPASSSLQASNYKRISFWNNSFEARVVYVEGDKSNVSI